MSRWVVEWTPPDSSLYDEYGIYWRKSDSPDWLQIGSTRGTHYVTHDMPEEGDFVFGVAPWRAGIEASEEEWTIVECQGGRLSDLTTPPAPTNFRAAQDGPSAIRCEWMPAESTWVSRFEIRQGSTWKDGYVRATVGPATRQIVIGSMATGETTLRIKAISEQGVESAEATSTITIQADEYGPTQGTHDEHAGGYTGTKTNVEVVGGNLQPTALPALFSSWANTYTTYTHPWWWPYIPDGTYVTAWFDAAVLADERPEIALTAAPVDAGNVFSAWHGQLAPEFDDTQDAQTARTPAAQHVYDEIAQSGELVGGLDVLIEIDTSQDAVPTPDGWRPWVPGATYRYREVRFRFTFGMAWPWLYPRFTGLTIKRRRQNRKAEGSVTIGVTGGTVITFPSGRFTVAPNVTATSIGTTALFATAEAVAVADAAVRLWDAAGVEQSAGTVHWIATGV